MKNEGNRGGDVRWLDERALHAAVIGGDPEAFGELMRRYESVVRQQLGRVLGPVHPGATEGALAAAAQRTDERVAEFWCGLMRRDHEALREWDADRCGLLAPWLGVLASRAGALELRRRMQARTRRAEPGQAPRSLAQ